MTITIPRADIQAIGDRHKVDYDLDFDPTVEWVRAIAAHLRGRDDFNIPPSDDNLAEADALDALADRIEREAAA